ncbi:MAG TPA: peptide chain release factor N(5)-glutamine methyltransferase [Clostridia bacterium]
MKNKKVKKTLIGGQAVMEGVMMRGRYSMALAVRDPQGNLLLKTERLSGDKSLIHKIPVIRGAVLFFQTLILGVKTLLKSAEVYSEEDGQTELKASDAFFAVFLGLAFSIALFMFLPSLISDGVNYLAYKWWNYKSDVLTSVVEGVTRLIIFLAYLVIVSFIKDIKRTFMYHGAEHKTINCYEKDLELTVENVKKCSRIHDRCGTTFLFLVMIVSIILFSVSNALVGYWNIKFLATWYGKLITRLILLPLVAGISYEILKGLALLPDNLFVKIIKAPGLALQFLTTKEPDEGMIEAAIKAFSAVETMDQNPDIPCVDWEEMDFKQVQSEFNNALLIAGLEQVEADWIFCHILKVKRAELASISSIKRTQYYAAKKILTQRILNRTPLQYLLGDVDFCGHTIKVNKNVLIPRFETEILADLAAKKAQDLAKEPKILDLCTGSGCIAVVLADAVKKAQIIASDISKAALNVAAENFKPYNNITAIESDLFANINGQFDIIVTNPPYVKTGELADLSPEVKQEPVKALDGGEDGLDIIRRILDDAHKYLVSGGYLMMEAGLGQPQIIKEIIQTKYGEIYKDIEIIKDLDGIERIIMFKKV